MFEEELDIENLVNLKRLGFRFFEVKFPKSESNWYVILPSGEKTVSFQNLTDAVTYISTTFNPVPNP